MPFFRRPLPFVVRVLFGVCCLLTALPAFVYWSESGRLELSRNQTSSSSIDPDPFFRLNIAGVRSPRIAMARDVKVSEDAEVFGVVVGGKARAYLVSAMEDRTKHIINDVLGGAAVSLAYCDLSDCVRAYREDDSEEPMDISVGGLLESEMVLKIQGEYYRHKSGLPLESSTQSESTFPYTCFEPERMTWKQWRFEHPETDIFVGD